MRAAAQRAHLGASTPPVFEAGYSTSKLPDICSGVRAVPRIEQSCFRRRNPKEFRG
jgi:hypothetical protein